MLARLDIRGGSLRAPTASFPPIPNELAIAALDPLVVLFNQLGLAAGGGFVTVLVSVVAGRDVVEDGAPTMLIGDRTRVEFPGKRINECWVVAEAERECDGVFVEERVMKDGFGGTGGGERKRKETLDWFAGRGSGCSSMV